MLKINQLIYQTKFYSVLTFKCVMYLIIWFLTGAILYMKLTFKRKEEKKKIESDRSRKQN